jgi:hypothetical protein
MEGVREHLERDVVGVQGVSRCVGNGREKGFEDANEDRVAGVDELADGNIAGKPADAGEEEVGVSGGPQICIEIAGAADHEARPDDGYLDEVSKGVVLVEGQ